MRYDAAMGEPDERGSTPHRRCLGCGYVLDGLPENRCPECGRGFDPADPDTFATSIASGLPLLASSLGALVVVVLGPLTFLLWPFGGWPPLQTMLIGIVPFGWLLSASSLSGCVHALRRGTELRYRRAAWVASIVNTVVLASLAGLLVLVLFELVTAL